MFTPLSGLCGCDKYLPLGYMCGLTKELELVSDPLECLMTDPYTFHGSTSPGNSTEPTVVTTVDNIATAWELSDVQNKCDVIQLDNNLNDEYVKICA